MKLLCAADLHLGRQPSRLPEDLRSLAPNLTPSATWHSLVDLAIEQQVDAVLLAGDVVENDEDFYGAYPDLLKETKRLDAQGIRVLAVSGNHDTLVLPRLAKVVPGFHLLGADGAWEQETLTGADGSTVQILGRSFPTATSAGNPLDDPLPARGPERRIGLLHCDRDSTSSPYAPVRSSQLDNADVDAWLLGHTHKPDITNGPRPSGYLGSLVGTDPGEPGAHGVWILEVASGGELSLTQLPIAPLRWEELEVDVTPLQHADDVDELITKRLDDLHHQLRLESERPFAVGCRLIFTGRTNLRNALQGKLDRDNPLNMPSLEMNGTSYFIHDWDIRALPARNLAEEAEGKDPAAILARKLLAVRGEGDTSERDALLRAGREQLTHVLFESTYKDLPEQELSDEDIIQVLQDAALIALDALEAQKDAEP